MARFNIHDFPEWDDAYERGDIAKETVEFLVNAGYVSEEDFRTDVNKGVEWEIVRNEDGEWWIEREGERVSDTYSDDDNAVIWDFFDWYEAEYDEPPEKDITSPGGKGK